MIIEFGDCRLVPVDALNWELCHRHESARGKNAGRVQWNRLRRYYQYNTLANAIRYAADCELRDGAHGRAMELEDALHEYGRITARLAADVARALEGRSDGQ